MRWGLRQRTHRSPDARAPPNLPAAPAASYHMARRGRNLKAKRGHPLGRERSAGWRCDARVTANQMRAHRNCGVELSVARCARTSQYARIGRRHLATWSDDGERMKCDWRCDTRLTASRMRAHFNRPKARAFHEMPEAAGSLTSSGPTREGQWTPTEPRMHCGWRCGARLPASRMRAPFTSRYTRSALGLNDVDRRGKTLEPSTIRSRTVCRMLRSGRPLDSADHKLLWQDSRCGPTGAIRQGGS
jgi:hypothetical protein